MKNKCTIQSISLGYFSENETGKYHLESTKAYTILNTGAESVWLNIEVSGYI